MDGAGGARYRPHPSPRGTGDRALSTRDRRAAGRRGEELAAAFLHEHGFHVVARNVHLRFAELDLVALEGRTLCIVEVRLRSGRRFGSAEESVDARKRARLVRAARLLLATRRLPPHDSVRFDVVAIDTAQCPARLRLIRGAFYVA